MGKEEEKLGSLFLHEKCTSYDKDTNCNICGVAFDKINIGSIKVFDAVNNIQGREHHFFGMEIGVHDYDSDRNRYICSLCINGVCKARQLLRFIDSIDKDPIEDKIVGYGLESLVDRSMGYNSSYYPKGVLYRGMLPQEVFRLLHARALEASKAPEGTFKTSPTLNFFSTVMMNYGSKDMRLLISEHIVGKIVPHIKTEQDLMGALDVIPDFSNADILDEDGYFNVRATEIATMLPEKHDPSRLDKDRFQDRHLGGSFLNFHLHQGEPILDVPDLIYDLLPSYGADRKYGYDRFPMKSVTISLMSMPWWSTASEILYSINQHLTGAKTMTGFMEIFINKEFDKSWFVDLTAKFANDKMKTIIKIIVGSAQNYIKNRILGVMMYHFIADCPFLREKFLDKNLNFDLSVSNDSLSKLERNCIISIERYLGTEAEEHTFGSFIQTQLLHLCKLTLLQKRNSEKITITPIPKIIFQMKKNCHLRVVYEFLMNTLKASTNATQAK